jgi:hypothetical protein
LLNRNYTDEVTRSAGWQSLRRNAQFAEESLRRWITKLNIAVPVALEKQIRNSKGVSKKPPFSNTP